MCAPRHVVGGCVLIRTGMATSLPMLRETSPAKLHRLPWCCERLCTRSSNLRHFSTHGWACEASGETCPRSEPFWRLNCFSLSPCRLCDGESLLSEHARPRPLLARWPHGLPFFSATFALRCPVQLADPPPRRIACRNCCQNYDEKRRPQIVKSPIEHHRDTVYRDHGIAHSPLLGVSPVTQRSKQRHRTDRRTLAKHHAHEEAYRLTRPGRYAACAFLGWMMCASVVMCMCVLHEARICRRKGRNLCTRRLRSARPQSRG